VEARTGGKALEGGNPKGVTAWNKAGRHREKESARRLRKPESATNQVRQAWGKWVPGVESVEGEKTPRG
jgi:hypothetical protein